MNVRFTPPRQENVVQSAVAVAAGQHPFPIADLVEGRLEELQRSDGIGDEPLGWKGGAHGDGGVTTGSPTVVDRDAPVGAGVLGLASKGLRQVSEVTEQVGSGPPRKSGALTHVLLAQSINCIGQGAVGGSYVGTQRRHRRQAPWVC
jgi:hypothetical protein